MHSVDLINIYLETLARCAPDVLVQEHVDASMPRNVVAIGKCAGLLLDGAAKVHPIDAAFVAIPEGYPLPKTRAEIHLGGHPHMTAASFAAGDALLRFVAKHDDILFLISGGGSACVEVALAPHTQDEVAEQNARLVASNLPIADINRERSKLSAIKAGRLRERVRGRCVTLVYSDVSTGRVEDVASGPTGGGIRIADNDTLTLTAAQLIGENALLIHQQIECDVEEAAMLLAACVAAAQPGQILVGGGEPTVLVRGSGKGGRCSELAVHFAAKSTARALFAASDGVDGNSGAAGIYLPPRDRLLEMTELQHAVAASDTFTLAAQVGEPLTIAPTGNNLRDLFLLSPN
jgi:hydroxypyruvate reductase